MKLFWGDYHKATRHLTTAQHGAYFLLIGEAWRLGGCLPNDDQLLAKWALCSTDEWAEMRGVILAFFSLRRGKFVHDRVREELAHYDDVSRKRKGAGKTGGLATGRKVRENPPAIAEQLTTKPEPEPEPKKEEETKVSSRRGSKRCPSDFTPSQGTLDVGKDCGLSPEETAGELAQFRDYTFATARSDWEATFRNWLRNAAKRRPAARQAPPADARRANTESRRSAWVDLAQQRDSGAFGCDLGPSGDRGGTDDVSGYPRLAYAGNGA